MCPQCVRKSHILTYLLPLFFELGLCTLTRPGAQKASPVALYRSSVQGKPAGWLKTVPLPVPVRDPVPLPMAVAVAGPEKSYSGGAVIGRVGAMVEGKATCGEREREAGEKKLHEAKYRCDWSVQLRPTHLQMCTMH